MSFFYVHGIHEQMLRGAALATMWTWLMNRSEVKNCLVLVLLMQCSYYLGTCLSLNIARDSSHECSTQGNIQRHIPHQSSINLDDQHNQSVATRALAKHWSMVLGGTQPAPPLKSFHLTLISSTLNWHRSEATSQICDTSEVQQSWALTLPIGQWCIQSILCLTDTALWALQKQWFGTFYAFSK